MDLSLTISNSIEELNNNFSDFKESYADNTRLKEKQYDLMTDIRSDIADFVNNVKQIRKDSATIAASGLEMLKSVKTIQYTLTSKLGNMGSAMEKTLKTEFSLFQTQIKKLRESIESGTTEGGLDKENGLTKFYDKMKGILSSKGNVNNTTVSLEEKKKEESGFLMTLLKVGGLFAGLATIWGFIQDNPELKKLFGKIGDMMLDIWNKNIWPGLSKALDWVWKHFKIGVEDLWKRFMRLVGGIDNAKWIAGIAAIGGVGIAIAGLLGPIGTLSAALKGLGLLANPLTWIIGGSAAAIYSIKKTFDTLVDMEKNISRITSTNTGMIIQQERKEHQRNLGKDYDRLTSQVGNIDERVNIAGPELVKHQTLLNELKNKKIGFLAGPLGMVLQESAIRKEQQIVDDLNKKATVTEEEHALRRKMSEIRAQNERFQALKQQLHLKDYKNLEEAESALKQNSDTSPELRQAVEDAKAYRYIDGKLKRIDTVVPGNGQPLQQNPTTQENIPMSPEGISKADETNALLKRLNELMETSNQINMEGHTLNAQATVASVPPPPQINIPKQPNSGPNSSRKLADFYSDTKYSLA